MKLEVGEISGKMIAVLIVLVVGGLGYGWWQYMYTPAIAARETATQERDAAQQSLAADQKKLQDANSLSASDSSHSDDHKAIGRIQIAKTAIPRGNETLLPAMQQIERLVRKSGVDATISDATSGGDAAAAGGSGTSSSASVTLSGHASYGMLLGLIRAINDTGRVYRGKVYVSDRLLAITDISVNAGDSATAAAASSSSGTSTSDTSATASVPAGHVSFTMTVVFYMETVGSSTGAAAGAATNPAGAAAASGAATPTTGGAPATSGASTPTSGTATSSPTAPTGTPQAAASTPTASPS